LLQRSFIVSLSPLPPAKQAGKCNASEAKQAVRKKQISPSCFLKTLCCSIVSYFLLQKSFSLYLNHSTLFALTLMGEFRPKPPALEHFVQRTPPSGAERWI
jgi:hypothetical protein